MVHLLHGWQEGFHYHHAEPDYLMLVHWISESTTSTIPANATHRVGIGAIVMNDKREVFLQVHDFIIIILVIDILQKYV